MNKFKYLLPVIKHRALIDVCRTRWISRIDGLDIIVELFIAILGTLEDIRLNKNGEEDAAGEDDTLSLSLSLLPIGKETLQGS